MRTKKLALPVATLASFSMLTFNLPIANAHEFTQDGILIDDMGESQVLFTEPDGAQATIYTPVNATPSTGTPEPESSAWVMLTDNRGSAEPYVQAGFFQNYQSRFYFFELSPDGGVNVDYFFTTAGQVPNQPPYTGTGPAVDSTHVYKIWADPSHRLWQGTVDGAFSSSFYCSAMPTNWQPNQIEVVNEVHFIQSAHYFGKATDQLKVSNPVWLKYDSTGQNLLSNSLQSPVIDYDSSGYGSITPTSAGGFTSSDSRNFSVLPSVQPMASSSTIQAQSNTVSQLIQNRTHDNLSSLDISHLNKNGMVIKTHSGSVNVSEGDMLSNISELISAFNGTGINVKLVDFSCSGPTSISSRPCYIVTIHNADTPDGKKAELQIVVDANSGSPLLEYGYHDSSM